ncbi:uncharacterized protein EDB93DRAFT_1108430 [Suillus bovinus]|uniref:uncharacterized protein n=1 Tax=Suillus bovinus TaxID=48563 RepID=UPI001B8600E2|nr:uncharacterized protein EDB93DRAFT_1108430 [Suillus bovinus]KAG2130317.1 hypothetical protein EDB93DRAFT_1108430 [Suillus bovinus]
MPDIAERTETYHVPESIFEMLMSLRNLSAHIRSKIEGGEHCAGCWNQFWLEYTFYFFGNSDGQVQFGPVLWEIKRTKNRTYGLVLSFGPIMVWFWFSEGSNQEPDQTNTISLPLSHRHHDRHIGKAIASALVQNGAKVYIAARKELQLKETHLDSAILFKRAVRTSDLLL